MPESVTGLCVYVHGIGWVCIVNINSPYQATYQAHQCALSPVPAISLLGKSSSSASFFLPLTILPKHSDLSLEHVFCNQITPKLLQESII